jgi:5-methyltetrahydropteroyltriglutamate--homocysteine methyltransferase
MDGVRAFNEGRIGREELDRLYDTATRQTIRLFEQTLSPVITDGEQRKPSFISYPFDGLKGLVPDGAQIVFSDGHVRKLPLLTEGPFRYGTYADSYLRAALGHTRLPVKQAVISASALSLLYPKEGIKGYPRSQFIEDLVSESEKDIRRCLDAGAYNVQIDFTEGRLAIKLDPSGQLLKDFVQLNNRVLERFNAGERRRIGVHTCPGGDRDSTHSADVDYALLLPDLFELLAGNFYVQLASEHDRTRVLDIIARSAKDDQRIFVGVIDPIHPRVETAEEVEARTLEAAEYIQPERLGTTDDCGFSPFGDDLSTARETAFAKIKARVEGTARASQKLGI